MSELKIIQLIPMENNASWQGAILGLGNDGVVYEFSNIEQKWIVCIPLEFSNENKTESTELEQLRKEHDELKDSVSFVYDTFKKDLDSGYSTRDKVFACDVLSNALRKLNQQGE